MKSEFDELKRFAVADILSVSGKEKAKSTINKHIDNIIDVAMAREQHQQSKVDELQKRLDAVKTLIEEYRDPPTEDKTFQHALSIVADELEQALKGGPTPNLNTDKNGECLHFSTTMFADGKAECFQCDAVVNKQREVIGKQSKDLHPFFKREPK